MSGWIVVLAVAAVVVLVVGVTAFDSWQKRWAKLRAMEHRHAVARERANREIRRGARQTDHRMEQ